MTYCTEQDLIPRFGREQLLIVVDRDAEGRLDTDVVAAAIADAAAEIDAYLRERYALPLASVDPRLEAVACDIAFYRLHPAAAPDDVRQRYLDAIAWLKDVAAGRAGIDTGVVAESAAGSAQVSAPPRIFDRDSLKGY